MADAHDTATKIAKDAPVDFKKAANDVLKTPSGGGVHGGGGCATCNMLCQAFDGISSKELFTWARPVATGIVVAKILSLVFVFGYLEYSLVTFVCRVLQLLLIAVGIAAYLKLITINAADVHRAANGVIEKLEPGIVSATNCVLHIAMWENVLLSGVVFAVSVFVAMLGNLLVDSTLILLLTICAFGGTPLYFQFQDKIDPAVNKGIKEVRKIINGKLKKD